MASSPRLSPYAMMRRKAEAERNASRLHEARLYYEDIRAQLRWAEAEAGRSAAVLRTALRELDWAMVQLREAKEKIISAVDGSLLKRRAHDNCLKSPTSVMAPILSRSQARRKWRNRRMLSPCMSPLSLSRGSHNCSTYGYCA